MTSEPRVADGGVVPYVEDPTGLQRFCRHYFRFAVGFGMLLGLAAVLNEDVVLALAGGAFLLTGVAAGYKATE